ncbi:MAG TPA: cation diffusion facilitator family transporter, partial [Candidatus Anaerofilum excrementigallinarum]|nr:cation diffusion facilitator family transporter [Candidatus Anaerofilum excrementigallinarum]
MTEFLLKHFVKGYPDTSSPAVRTRCGNLAGTVGIVCNVLLCAGKFLAGFLSGSLAISADAVNNLSDASSSVIALLGFRIAAKPADDEHPYGHGRTEYLAGLAVSVMILLIGLELVKTSVGKIMAPEPIQAGLVPLAVLVVSILVKLWMAAFNRQVGKQIGSSVLEATAADSRNDVIATSAVLVATLAQMIFGWQLDGWIGLAVAAFILYSGWGLVKEAIAPLLGQAPDPEMVRHILEVTRSYPGVLGIHDLIVHDYGPGRQFASLHVEMAASQDVLASHDVIDQIERRFLEQEGLHVIIHYDPIVTDNNEVGEAREYLAKQVKRLDPRLTIHDLRMVPGETHTNLIFDLVVP